MNNFYFQNDERWKDIKLARTNVTIGSHGCLITGATNIFNFAKGEDVTPELTNKMLIAAGGYTKNGWVIWDSLSKLMSMRIDHDYKGTVDYEMGVYYLAAYPTNFAPLHFVNVISKDNYDYYLFDVWNNKRIVKKQHEITRFVKFYS